MFTIIGEHHYNDFTKERFEKSFSSLDGIFEWLRSQSGNFNGKYGNYFPKANDIRSGDIRRISIADCKNLKWLYWIYEIRTEEGIVFSTGKNTNGHKFCAKKILEWIIVSDKKMKEIQDKPNFVEI